MREIVHCQVGQCGNQIGSKVGGNLSETQTNFFFNYPRFSPFNPAVLYPNHEFFSLINRLPIASSVMGKESTYFFFQKSGLFYFLFLPPPPEVLGGDLRRARHRPGGPVRGGGPGAAGQDLRLLQRGPRGQVRAALRPGGPGAGNHGLHQGRALRTGLQAGQLRLRAERRRCDSSFADKKKRWRILWHL